MTNLAQLMVLALIRLQAVPGDSSTHDICTDLTLFLYSSCEARSSVSYFHLSRSVILSDVARWGSEQARQRVSHTLGVSDASHRLIDLNQCPTLALQVWLLLLE